MICTIGEREEPTRQPRGLLDSPESVMKGRNNGIKMGHHERPKSRTSSTLYYTYFVYSNFNFSSLNVLGLGRVPHPCYACALFFHTTFWDIYVLQGVRSGRHVSDCHSVWQELRQLSRKMGDCFCYIYGTVIVIWLAALTLPRSLYGGLIGVFNHGIHLKGITLLCNALLCI